MLEQEEQAAKVSDRRFDASFALVLTNDSARRYHEAQRRAAERVPRQFQEAGHLSSKAFSAKSTIRTSR